MTQSTTALDLSRGDGLVGGAAQLATQRLFVMVDADGVIRAAGGDDVAWASSYCGRRLSDLLGRDDATFDGVVREVLAGADGVRRAVEAVRDGAAVTLDVELSGLVDQSGQRMAIMWATIGGHRPDPRDVLSLSERESEILDLVADGLRVATIARHLYISPSTVRNHLSSIFRKAGVKNQAELLEWLRNVPRPLDAAEPSAGGTLGAVLDIDAVEDAIDR